MADARSPEAELAAFVAETEEIHRELIPGDGHAKELREALGGALWLLVNAVQVMPLTKVPNAMSWRISDYVVTVTRPNGEGFPQLFMKAKAREERAIKLAEELNRSGKIDAESLSLLRAVLEVLHG